MDKLKENRFAKEFDHYINAYLNSARSVMWVIHNEFSKKIFVFRGIIDKFGKRFLIEEENDAVEVCEEYYSILDNLVKECVKKFN